MMAAYQKHHLLMIKTHQKGNWMNTDLKNIAGVKRHVFSTLAVSVNKIKRNILQSSSYSILIGDIKYIICFMIQQASNIFILK